VSCFINLRYCYWLCTVNGNEPQATTEPQATNDQPLSSLQEEVLSFTFKVELSLYHMKKKKHIQTHMDAFRPAYEALHAVLSKLSLEHPGITERVCGHLHAHLTYL
jgi:hypothetical protein